MSSHAPIQFGRALRGRLLLSSTAIAIGLAVTAAPAFAQTWDGSDSNDTEDGNNWIGDVAPAAGGAAVVDSGATNFQPLLTIARTYDTLTVSNTGTFTIGGTGNLTVTSGASLIGGGVLTINALGSLTGNLFAASTSASSNAGSIDGTLTVTAGTFNNAGAVSGATTISGGTLNLNAGSNLADAQAFTVNGGAVNLNLDETVGTLSGTGGTISAGSAGFRTLTVNQAVDGTFAGSLQNGSGIVILTKEGAAKLTLSGSNTQTGDTNVNAGTLELTGGSALLDSSGVNLANVAGANLLISASETIRTVTGGGAAGGNVQIAAGQVLTIAPSAAESYAGVISGAGGLTKAGVGTQTLTGANTYDGVTSVDQGTLVAGASGALGSTAGGTTVAAGATLALTGGITTAEAITLNGTGVALGGALRNLSGNNEVNGTTTLGSATRINSDAGQLSVGAITGTGQSLTLGGAGIVFVFGAITTGTGTLTKDGAGVVGLGGSNTFTGATSVNAGILLLQGAANTALSDTALTSVAAGATLQVDVSETVGSLSGAGTVDLNGALVTLTTGGDGTSTTYSGALVGTGGFTKVGAGTHTFAGANTYLGPTVVNGGTLVVDGSIASSSLLFVGGGATVGGIGTLPDTSILAGGALAPGNSIGTITVNGDLVFDPGSTYAVEVSPTDADRTNVTNQAFVSGGTVATTYAPGAYIQRQYVIVNATGGVVGTFAGITGTAPTGFTQSLAYDANNAYLVLSLVIGGGGPGPYSGLNANKTAVAGAITQSFIANGGILAAFGTLDANGLTQTSGEPVTGAMGAGFDAAGQFMGVIGQPGTGAGAGNGGAPLGYTSEGAMLGYAVDAVQAVDGERRGRTLSSNTALAALAGENEDAATKAATSLAMSGVHNADDIIEAAFATRWKLWGAAYGGGETVRGNATVGSNTLTASTWGVASGVSRTFDGGSLGIVLGGAGTSFSLANGLGGGNATSFNAGIHGTVNLSDAAYLSGALAYGYHATRTTRNVPGDTLSGRFGAHTFSGRAEAGYRLNLGGVELTPYGAVEATVYNLPAYAETSANGGPFALAFGRQSQTNVRTELGARTAIDLGSGVKLTGRAAWVWNAQNGRAVSAAFQALPGTTFTVNGAAPARHAALLDLGLEAALADNLSAKLSFTGEFSRNVSSYGAQAKISLKW